MFSGVVFVGINPSTANDCQLALAQSPFIPVGEPPRFDREDFEWVRGVCLIFNLCCDPATLQPGAFLDLPVLLFIVRVVDIFLLLILGVVPIILGFLREAMVDPINILAAKDI